LRSDKVLPGQEDVKENILDPNETFWKYKGTVESPTVYL
jgi:hypothetical protein